MLRNGLRSPGSRPASSAASAASGERRSARARSARAARRGRSRARAAAEWSAFDHGDVLLDEVVVVLGDGDVEPAVRDDPAAVDRVLAGLVERDELVVLLVVGEVEAGGEADGLERDLARPLELLDERLRARACAGARYKPPTRTLIGCTSRPPTTRHHLVADLLQLERLRDRVRVVARQLDRALVAEEVGQVEHVDVERVALDPLAAVEEPAQRAQLAADLDAAGLLHRARRRSSGRRPGRCRRCGR